MRTFRKSLLTEAITCDEGSDGVHIKWSQAKKAESYWSKHCSGTKPAMDTVLTSSGCEFVHLPYLT